MDLLCAAVGSAWMVNATGRPLA